MTKNKKKTQLQAGMSQMSVNSPSVNSPAAPSMLSVPQRPALPDSSSAELAMSKPKRNPRKASSSQQPESSPAESKTEMSAEVTPQVMVEAEVMNFQPTINIGCIGHVAHGKSTITRALSGVSTAKFQKEVVRNMTIKLGYANVKIFRCRNLTCPAPGCYACFPSTQMEEPPCSRPDCDTKMQLVRHISLVDSPGHHDLLSTMLTGAAVMDGALMVIAANEPCPAPQTAEHLAAAEIMGVSKQTVVVQNKIDLCTPEQCRQNGASIRGFLKGTRAEKAPIIPVTAQLGINVDVLALFLASKIPTPVRDLQAPARMLIIRSFDVNKPGLDISALQGGVVGGSILAGVLHVGQKVELRPGVVTKDSNGGLHVEPVFGKVLSLKSEQTSLERAIPGGLIAVGLDIDPTLTKGDRLVGHVLGAVGALPPVFQRCTMVFKLMKEAVGVPLEDSEEKDDEPIVTPSDPNVQPPKPVRIKLQRGQILRVCVGSMHANARIRKIDGKKMSVQLGLPLCAERGSHVALFANLSQQSRWRLIGTGIICDQEPLALPEPPVEPSEAAKTGQNVQSSPPSTDACVAEETEDNFELVEGHQGTADEHGAEEQKQSSELPNKSEKKSIAVNVEGVGTSRMYEREYPRVGDQVMVCVQSIQTDAGATVSLLEYDGLHGFLPREELNHRRIRSIKKYINVGHTHVLTVTKVIPQNSYVEVSLKRVTDQEKVHHSAWFAQCKVLHSILTRVAVGLGMSLNKVCEMIAWPLYKVAENLDLSQFGDPNTDAQAAPDRDKKLSTAAADVLVQDVHPLDILRRLLSIRSQFHLVASSPIAIPDTASVQQELSEDWDAELFPDMDDDGEAEPKDHGDLCDRIMRHLRLLPAVEAELMKNVAHRLTQKPLRMRAEMQITCCAGSGAVGIIKAAIMEALRTSQCSSREEALDEDETPCKVMLDTPPIYVITMTCRDKLRAVKEMSVLGLAIAQRIQAAGGSFAWIKEPYPVLN